MIKNKIIYVIYKKDNTFIKYIPRSVQSGCVGVALSTIMYRNGIRYLKYCRIKKCQTYGYVL